MLHPRIDRIYEQSLNNRRLWGNLKQFGRPKVVLVVR